MLTKRQLLILKAIVDDYIKNAEPVGSRSVSKRKGINFSPATIRNEMSDLEELGFLVKTHSSSGRIPSQKGYRYYVDHLLSPKKLSEEEIKRIRSVLQEKFSEFEEVIQESAKILSNLTNYTSIVLGPEVFESTLKQVQIIPLSKETAVAIIVTDTGHVENQTVTLPSGMKAGDMEKVVNILNEQLKGVPLVDLKRKLNKEVSKILAKYIDHYDEMMRLLNKVFLSQQNEKIYFGGKANILTQPEFKDVERVKQLFNIFEEDALVTKLFRSDYDGITIKIGEENEFEPFDECTVVTATYSIDGKYMGTISLLGPTRMAYPRVVGIMDYLTKDLSKLLKSRYGK